MRGERLPAVLSLLRDLPKLARPGEQRLLETWLPRGDLPIYSSDIGRIDSSSWVVHEPALDSSPPS
jgi:hypothetical protein